MNTVESVSIQPIDKSTVNQICSGQVVLNLATAVKELLENSIDAGADSIQVKLEEFGSESIEVVDNGCGVEEVNFQALTLKHHTSKIREFSDLYSVETFGFRGEALSSLCSLSDVTIVTQHKNAEIGATLKFDHNGIIINNVKTLRKTGTTVKLENLFSTLPIRRTEFLKNLKREYSKMCNVLYAYGLQSKGVRITCTNHTLKSKLTNKDTQEGNQKRFTSTTIMDTKGDSLESNISSIFGIKQKQNLLKITEKPPTEETLAEFNLQNRKLDLEKFKLSGFISSCAHGCGRTSSDRQYYFINSRPVDNPKISKLVNDIYHQYNNRQDPFVVLNITVACGSFDVNLTPDKRQILLQNEKLLLAVLKESLLSVFKNIPCTMEIQNGRLSNEFASSEKTAAHQRFEKFKSNFPGKSAKKEETHSRIDALLKFRMTSKSSTKAPTCDIAKERFSAVPKSKPEVATPAIKNDIVLFVKPIKSLQDSPESKYKSETESENKKKSKVELESKSDTNAVTLTEATVTVEENVLEIPDNEDVSDERINTEDGRQNSENKRKLLLSEQENIFDEAEENDSKRMKFDEGLLEEEKNKRKSVLLNVTLTDVKKLSLRNANCAESDEHDGEVKFLSEIKPQNNERAENELKRELKKENFKQMKIIGQFNLGFIIAQLGSDIFIIDQHASDEKYNFETLQATTTMQTQALFNPEKLELTVDKEELMVQHRDVFKKNGFDFVFDKDGPSTRRISLTRIPMSKNYVFGKDDVDELLFLLEDAPDVNNLRPSRVSSMFASRACRKSVMIGTPLSHQEMRKVVDHMGEIEHPWNCPHGRPTMRHLVNLGMIQLKE